MDTESFTNIELTKAIEQQDRLRSEIENGFTNEDDEEAMAEKIKQEDYYSQY